MSKTSSIKLIQDASLSGTVAGLLVILVGMTSSAVLVFQAATNFGVDAQGAGSWLGALCLGGGALGLILSLYYKVPVLLAWSTPGAALLAGSMEGISLNQAVGAFIFSSLLIFLFGVTGLFAKMMNRIPLELVSALLGGILLKYCLQPFVSFKTQPLIIGSMLITYLLSKKFKPRLTMLLVLIVGTIVSASLNQLQFSQLALVPTQWQFVAPEFSVSALLSIGLPLFIVTMVSQNLTGLAVMKTNGYEPKTSMLLTTTGLTNIVTSFFGGFAINLAAITAAIAMGPESHEDKSKRYFAGVVSGVLYIVIGLMAGSVTSLFAAFPTEMIAGIAGLALLNTTTHCLHTAFANEDHKESAFLTFAIAASGVTIFGVGSALWGIIVGGIAHMVLNKKKFKFF